MIRTSIPGVFLIAVLAARTATATVTYSDGGMHAVNSSSPDIRLSKGTTLNVGPGAVITGPTGPQGAPDITLDAISTLDGSGNHIHVTGGSISGGTSTAS